MSTLIQRSFSAGEISPSLYQRVDLTKYSTGLRKALNGYIEKDGGFTNRGGTTFVNIFAVGNMRQIPWESNSNDGNYVLLFRVSEINFIQNGSLVHLSAPAPAYSGATNYAPGDLVLSAGVTYYCKRATIGNAPPNATYWHQLFSDSVGVIYAIPTPFAQPDSIEDFQFVQETNRMTMVHGRSLPVDLVRNSHTNWVLEYWRTIPGTPDDNYGVPDIDSITDLAASGGGSGGAAYYVTAINQNDFEESLISNLAETVTIPSSGTPVNLTWTAIPGAYGYNVYRQFFGVYKLIYFVISNSFQDTGYDALADGDSPPEIRSELSEATGTFPNKIGIYQQRTMLGNFSFNTQAIYASKIGLPQNFTRKFPSADDDSILFQIKGKKINGIRHIIDLGALIILTDSGEWVVKGNQNGILKPDSAQPEQYGYNGSNDVAPAIVGSDAIYIQRRGSIPRALGFDSISGGRDGFRDDDLSIFASHLFKSLQITAIAYQQTPNSILWMVRSDGVLLSLTYIRNQQILAWCRHETDGLVVDVCSIPEGDEHAVYITVQRVLNGTTVYSVERMNNRNVDDVRDYVFMDCALSYDGRNTSGTTMTVSGGTAWDHSELLTLTASAGFFFLADEGNEIQLTGPDGTMIRMEIVNYVSATVVEVHPSAIVPVSMRGVALTTWAKAVDELSGLTHLNGKSVSVFADGYVIASPNNDKYPALTVSAGALTLNQPYAVIHVGLPFITDLETLDIDTVNGETIVDKRKLVGKVSMHVEGTRGLFVGGEEPQGSDPLKGLMELKLREYEDYNQPIELATGVVDVVIESSWNSNGRVLVRQVDPIPMSIKSVAPAGLFPFRG